ncbi:tyrosine-type recombinase/integrase [Lutibacter sp.]|uniref:tyrosine-type recombinase/integrase n=1 Tax=Lutibacter sp. TaxID=1925666 RepID=UPI0035681F79
MPKLIELLIFEHRNEHRLPIKKPYSAPKIYTANNNLKKRWFVYYYFRNPKTGLLERMGNVYGNANRYKTKEERLSILTSFQKNLHDLLKKGYNPFEDNQEVYNQEIEKDPSSEIKKVKISDIEIEVPKKMNIKEAIDFVLNLKKQTLNHTSYRGLNNRINNFIEWIQKNHSKLKTVEQLNKKVITEFLNFQLEKTSARNRNNFRSDLSSVFQILEDNEIILTNYIKSIPTLKSIPTRNKTYSNELQQNIYTHLEKNDPLLLLYIKFISYNLLRPIEVCRLKIKDLNIKERKLQFKAKNSPLKIKIIPEILIKELPDLSKLNPEDDLFTPEKIGGEWKTNENDKRNYFSKRFKKIVKDHFNLGSDYGLYSFRHTFITKLYRELNKDSSPFEAKSKLMLITGHSTMDALEKYLRDIDAELPEDYSGMLE